MFIFILITGHRLLFFLGLDTVFRKLDWLCFHIYLLGVRKRPSIWNRQSDPERSNVFYLLFIIVTFTSTKARLRGFMLAFLLPVGEWTEDLT
jgi:hypothetical protein